MIVDDLDFFKEFLKEDFIKYYINLSNQEDNKEINSFELNYSILLIEKVLNDSIKVNRKDKLIFLYNIFIYIILIIIYFDRDNLMEESLKCSLKQIKTERKILKLLKKSFIYSKNNLDDVTCNNISMILLLLSSLNVERNERVNLEKNNFTLLSGRYNNFSVNFFSDYDYEKLEFMLEKVKGYARSLKR